MKQMTREEFKAGIKKCLVNWSEADREVCAVLTYIESVSEVLRQRPLGAGGGDLYASGRRPSYGPALLLLPYDPRPKQPSAKKRAAEYLRTALMGFSREDAADVNALISELEAE